MNPSTTPASNRHLVAYANPSAGVDPGHLAIGEESRLDDTFYVGYRFDVVDLPRDFQHPNRWQDYFLNDHQPLPGHIFDETEYVRRLSALASGSFEKRVPTDHSLRKVLPPESEWNGLAKYSFNPDNFDTPSARCYNCVTWGVETANQVVADFLLPVRQGRIGLIVRQMASRPGIGAEVDRRE